jgi:hypothetical protein
MGGRYYSPLMKSYISSCNIKEILYNIDIPGNLNSYAIGNPMYFPINRFNIFTSIPLVPEIKSSDEWWSNFWGALGDMGKVIGGSLLAIGGAAFTLITLPIALVAPGGGFLTQLGFSTMMYGGFVVGSVFDEQIRTDMQNIGWNPFNSNEDLVINSKKVSFYKGMPTVWTNHSNGRSGSFLGIWLTGTNTADDIRHEWGHGIQQGIMGALRYGLMIGLPSYLEWGPWSYYNKPWEITADMFGGVSRSTHTQDDISRGWRYLAIATLLGPLAYLFLLDK